MKLSNNRGLGCLTVLLIVGVYYVLKQSVDGMTDFSENHSVVYDSTILLALLLLIYYMYSIFRNENRKYNADFSIIKENLERFSSHLKKLKESDSKLGNKKMSDESMYLSLDEQYEYIHQLDLCNTFELSSHAKDTLGIDSMKLSEMEERIKENAKQFRYYGQLYNKKNNDKSDYTVLLSIEEFDKRLETLFRQKYNIGFVDTKSYFVGRKNEILQALEDWNQEKEKVIWSIKQGVEGERRIVDNMKLILQEGHLLESVRIEHMGLSAESDIVYIGSTGVYSLEVKNFGEKGNWSIHISKDGQWQKVFPNGKREPMKDVGNQVNYHMAVKERFLNEKLKELYGESAPKVKVNPVVVIANDTVMIDNESDLPILRASSIYRYIEQGQNILTNEWQEKIAELLIEHSLPGKKYEIPNFVARLENILLESENLLSLYKLRYEFIDQLCDEAKLKQNSRLSRNKGFKKIVTKTIGATAVIYLSIITIYGVIFTGPPDLFEILALIGVVLRISLYFVSKISKNPEKRFRKQLERMLDNH